MKRILVIEDDPRMLLGLTDNLEHEGFVTITARDGYEGTRRAVRERPDLIILDVMLPKRNGFEVCRSLRQSGHSAPILMLTARSEERDKIHGFEFGADDYVTKPFSINELLARVKALLRRSELRFDSSSPYRSGDLLIDFRQQQAFKGGCPLALTALEFAVMRYLVNRRGEVVSRQELLSDVWGYDATTATRTVDSVMGHLRKKLRADDGPSHIVTVHGVGYKFID